MNNVSFGKQTTVYFKKITRIAVRENAWKFVAFAAIIAAIVAAVVSKNMFKNFESTKSGFFTLASACIWLGIFNSIQSICKEHDIIRSEYRQGMKMSSYVCANILYQAVLCLIQTIIIYVICLAFGYFEGCPSDGAFMPAMVEYFITLYLLVFGSAVMGIMVSSVASNPTTAMTIMPFVLILQLIMSGVLFVLEGFSEGVAYITFSKWGMSALGSTANMNAIPHKLVLDLEQNQQTLQTAQILKQTFDSNLDSAYTQEAGKVLVAWLWCIGITAVSAVVSIVSLKFKNRDS